jgi:hypothetical protein
MTDIFNEMFSVLIFVLIPIILLLPFSFMIMIEKQGGGRALDLRRTIRACLFSAIACFVITAIIIFYSVYIENNMECYTKVISAYPKINNIRVAMLIGSMLVVLIMAASGTEKSLSRYRALLRRSQLQQLRFVYRGAPITEAQLQILIPLYGASALALGIPLALLVFIRNAAVMCGHL